MGEYAIACSRRVYLADVLCTGAYEVVHDSCHAANIQGFLAPSSIGRAIRQHFIAGRRDTI